MTDSPEPSGVTVVDLPLVGNPRTCAFQEVFAEFPQIVGRSQALAGILHAALVAARSEIPILVEGESGTGKELIARAIHSKSQRKDRPFVSENCGAVPENLVEAELFGHEKGAFTGAHRQRPGLFERAAGGTVFLDEVGEMDLSIQRKLLRVIQEREVRRVGGIDTLPVDFRLVSATNRTLEHMVATGRFREDLYYRIQVTTLHMPTLRERCSDIPDLVEYFSRLFARETGKLPVQFAFSALEAMVKYRWPGNVRELRNEVWSHACSDHGLIEAHHLSPRILGKAHATETKLPLRRHGKKQITEMERTMLGNAIVEVLQRTNGNRTDAARFLGISRAALYRRLLKYNLIEWSPQDSQAARS